MAQSSVGKIRLFNDFTGVPNLITEITDVIPLGDFYAGGEGIEDTTAGVVPSITAPLSGSVTITGGNTNADTTFIGTQILFDVTLMGTLVAETRVQVPDLDTKEVFFGFTSILTIDEQLQDILINASATAFTCVADLAGFYFSNELTASATKWHAAHKGGATTASTTAASQTLAVGPTAGEWQVLRLEVDNNGDTRWYVDGVLKKTVKTAASLTSNMAAVLAFAANTTDHPIGDCDYMLVEAGRDWTV